MYHEWTGDIDSANAEKREIMLNCLIRCYMDMDNVDRVCELAKVHSFELMRKDLKHTIETITGESVEEAIKLYPVMKEI